ncbi:v-SNARE family protein [Cavenderia fasciculata]|uniref:V-SNARE family protein n=1 Tax=Cavenderia fasciculata TaxID=261658 RepID=F4PT38_CACFS|nr:v-SNARE family protein [Cavenderia fasciculata]EGG21614.1 v-SNARE family protein [Cavenderia fasciculata]|eukprot:XP_004359464.1 v-SNARE family protein [Cavenderia fasciculata]
MDLFDGIEKNYQHVCNTITKRIKLLPTFSGERRKIAIREAENDLNEAISYLTEMERAAQTSSQRVMYQQRVKQYQADIQKFKREVQKASQSYDYNSGQNGNNPFSNSPEDYQSQYDNQRQHLLQGYDTVTQTSDRLMRVHQISAQNEQIGEGIMVDLSKQRNQIIKMGDKLHETDENVKSARKVIGSMARRVATNKVILTFIIILLLGIIALIICLKWLR